MCILFAHFFKGALDSYALQTHKYHPNLHIFILFSHDIRVVEMNLQIMSASVSPSPNQAIISYPITIGSKKPQEPTFSISTFLLFY